MKCVKINERGCWAAGNIENELPALQQWVGGYIEIVPLAAELAVVCNEEGKLRGLPVTAMLTLRGGLTPVDTLCGRLLIVRTAEDGTLRGLLPGDAAEARLYVHPETEKAPSRRGA